MYKAKRIFCIACLGKKFVIQKEVGKEVIQIKPNLIWIIPRVGRLWDKEWSAQFF